VEWNLKGKDKSLKGHERSQTQRKREIGKRKKPAEYFLRKEKGGVGLEGTKVLKKKGGFTVFKNFSRGHWSLG